MERVRLTSYQIREDALVALIKKGCHVRFYKNGDFSIPYELDLSVFEGLDEHDQKFVRSMFSCLGGYVRMPAILDWFKDHSERRDWRFSSLLPEEYFAYEDNRLKGNAITSTWNWTKEIGKMLPQNDERRKALGEIVEQFGGLIESIHDEKYVVTLEEADRFTEKVLEVLNLFAVRS